MMNGLLLINLLAFIAVTSYAIYLFAKVVATRVAYIRLGKKQEYDWNMKEQINNVIKIVFGQSKLLKDKKSGAIHVMMFYGFLLVQFGAIDMFVKGLSPGNHLPFGVVYPAFTFSQQLVSLMILVSVVWAFDRRYVQTIVRLKRGCKAALVLMLLGTLMLSVLLGNGMAIVWHGESLSWTEPVASLIAFVFSWLPGTAAAAMFYVFWWVHTVTILAFLVYVPQSKHAHLIAA